MTFLTTNRSCFRAQYELVISTQYAIGLSLCTGRSTHILMASWWGGCVWCAWQWYLDVTLRFRPLGCFVRAKLMLNVPTLSIVNMCLRTLVLPIPVQLESSSLPLAIGPGLLIMKRRGGCTYVPCLSNLSDLRSPPFAGDNCPDCGWNPFPSLAT